MEHKHLSPCSASVLFCLSAVLCILPCILSCSASKRSAFADINRCSIPPEVQAHQLQNGLAVFTAENHRIPLVTIKVFVKAGAVNQDPSTVGLFHLLEHMTFCGNKLYRSQNEVMTALHNMGVSEYNGITSVSYTEYYCTVPKDQLENALAFWNAAVRTPLLNDVELEYAKEVVLNEISSNEEGGELIYDAYKNSCLYADAPWKLDKGGLAGTVRAATCDTLAFLHRLYYRPESTAVVISGDIEPKEALALTQKIWGSWKSDKGRVPPLKRFAGNPFSKTHYAAIAFSPQDDNLANVQVSFRAPDVSFDKDDVYLAYILSALLIDPNGKFRTALESDGTLNLMGGNGLSYSYSPSPDMSEFVLDANFREPKDKLAQRVERLVAKIRLELLPAIAQDESLFTKENIESLLGYIKDGFALASPNAEDKLSNLCYIWLSMALPDTVYLDKIQHVTSKDMQRFVKKYFTDRNPLVLIDVSPATMKSCGHALENLGCEFMGADNAYWYKNEQFIKQMNSSALHYGKWDKAGWDKFIQGEVVYEPEASASQGTASLSFPKKSDFVEQYTLANGIPLYVYPDSNCEVDSVSICVRGGTRRFGNELAGLSDLLFCMMQSSSEHYNYNKRLDICFKTQSSFTCYNAEFGDVINLVCLDKYLPDVLPLLTDSFLHPDYDRQLYERNLLRIKNNVSLSYKGVTSRLQNIIRSQTLAGHPYSTSVDATPDSVDNLLIENLKILHSELVNERNIFLLASGKVDADNLVAELNKTLGAISSSNGRVFDTPIAIPIKGNSDRHVFYDRLFKGTGLAECLSPGPIPGSREFAAATVASALYTSSLSTVLRERLGACYSIRAYVSNSVTPVCGVSIDRINFGGHLLDCVDYCAQVLAEGSMPESLLTTDEITYTDLAPLIEGYKRECFVRLLADQASAMNAVSVVGSELLAWGDFSFSDRLAELVMEVSQQEIINALRKYWIDNKKEWWILAGSDKYLKLLYGCDNPPVETWAGRFCWAGEEYGPTDCKIVCYEDNTVFDMGFGGSYQVNESDNSVDIDFLLGDVDFLGKGYINGDELVLKYDDGSEQTLKRVDWDDSKSFVSVWSQDGKLDDRDNYQDVYAADQYGNIWAVNVKYFKNRNTAEGVFVLTEDNGSDEDDIEITVQDGKLDFEGDIYTLMQEEY